MDQILVWLIWSTTVHYFMQNLKCAAKEIPLSWLGSNLRPYMHSASGTHTVAPRLRETWLKIPHFHLEKGKCWHWWTRKTEEDHWSEVIWSFAQILNAIATEIDSLKQVIVIIVIFISSYLSFHPQIQCLLALQSLRFTIFHIRYRSLGALRAPTSRLRPFGPALALRACLITSLTPFGRSGRVTHATLQWWDSAF